MEDKIKEIVSKYKKYISNIEWDTKTNKRKGKTKEANDEQILYYEEIIQDLAAIQSSAPLEVKQKHINQMEIRIDKYLDEISFLSRQLEISKEESNRYKKAYEESSAPLDKEQEEFNGLKHIQVSDELTLVEKTYTKNPPIGYDLYKTKWEYPFHIVTNEQQREFLQKIVPLPLEVYERYEQNLSSSVVKDDIQISEVLKVLLENYNYALELAENEDRAKEYEVLFPSSLEAVTEAYEGLIEHFQTINK